MPAKRVLMRKIKRTLELRIVFKLSNCAIAHNEVVSCGSVPWILERVKVPVQTSPLTKWVTDADEEQVFHPHA